MLQSAKRESYIRYKYNRNQFVKYIDSYKLLKGLYHSRYGNDDMDVLGISLIKIDDVLDLILKETYEKNKNAANVYKGMSTNQKNMLNVLKQVDYIKSKRSMAN